MKQVEYVSIGGYVFSFEDDACASAKEYLAQLESFYSGKESGAEVMEGIEERMAELLIEKSGQGGVVSQRMVSDVIAVLGRPEAIEEDPDAPGDPSGAGHSSPESGPVEASGRSSRNTAGTGAKPRRRLYRDPANGKLAGVCSGLGTFFNFDPSLFRILFVVFTLIGFLDFRLFWPFEPWIHISAPIVYLVLWLCMPAVKTVRQRDELHGRKGTVDDISERVLNTPKEECKVIDPESWKNVRRIFSMIFGVFFLLAGVAGIAFLCSFWWGAEVLGNSFFYNKMIERIAMDSPQIISFISVPLVMIAAILVVAIPLFIMLYAGVMLIFGLKSPKWRPGLVMFVVWLVILVFLTVSSLMTFAVID